MEAVGRRIMATLLSEKSGFRGVSDKTGRKSRRCAGSSTERRPDLPYARETALRPALPQSKVGKAADDAGEDSQQRQCVNRQRLQDQKPFGDRRGFVWHEQRHDERWRQDRQREQRHQAAQLKANSQPKRRLTTPRAISRKMERLWPTSDMAFPCESGKPISPARPAV